MFERFETSLSHLQLSVIRFSFGNQSCKRVSNDTRTTRTDVKMVHITLAQMSVSSDILQSPASVVQEEASLQ